MEGTANEKLGLIAVVFGGIMTDGSSLSKGPYSITNTRSGDILILLIERESVDDYGKYYLLDGSSVKRFATTMPLCPPPIIT